MKYKELFLIIAIASLLSTAPLSYADIIQGDASSSTSVTTNIQGSGEVHTYIQSTVNGQTKTLESNKPGTYTLNNNSSGNASSSKSTEHIAISTNPTPTPIATPSAVPKDIHATYMNVFTDVRLLFHEAVQQLLSFFRL